MYNSHGQNNGIFKYLFIYLLFLFFDKIAFWRSNFEVGGGEGGLLEGGAYCKNGAKSNHCGVRGLN